MKLFLQKPQADKHIRPMSQHCSPCLLQYNFIIKLETMQEDLRYIFNLIGANSLSNNLHIHATENETIPIQTTSAKNILKLDEKENIESSLTLNKEDEIYKYFSNVSSDLLFNVVEFIKDDLTLFDYKLPQFITDKLIRYLKQNMTQQEDFY